MVYKWETFPLAKWLGALSSNCKESLGGFGKHVLLSCQPSKRNQIHNPGKVATSLTWYKSVLH